MARRPPGGGRPDGVSVNAECRRTDAALAGGEAAAIDAARDHAKGCPRCTERIGAFDEISAAATSLRKSWDSPALWPKIRESLVQESFAPAPAPAEREPAPRMAPPWPAWIPIAAIATLFVVSFVGLQVFRPSLGDRQIFGVRALPKDPLLTDAALENVEKTERDYVRSIENLARVAQPRLDAAETPLLISYREKLLLLDNAIAELNGQIEMNRYNTHLRRQLLGVYAEKQQTLREVMKGVTS
ncbi:MAG TPA: hypothetical protein VLG15_03290 [Thermoanaerobaculia bacterium]|nr:hypothetical protein [Thermoanaerobaculia bacterium]